jgi:serine protease Do
MYPLLRVIAILITYWVADATGLRASAQQDVASTEVSKIAAEPSTDGSSAVAFLNNGGIATSVDELRLMEHVFNEVAMKSMRATVNIEVGQAQGSGVVVTRDGYVLTAAHVISRPNMKARITFSDGKQADAITLGLNPIYDSGMLKITDKGRWPYLDVGQSGLLNEGQWVMAIGHPGGLMPDRGLVVRAGRVLSKLDSVVRTDCALVGGDSGGPLVDMDGNVVGIHSRIGGQLSDNLHVPIDVFTEQWDELAIGKPYLGINLDDDRKVTRVVDDEAADLAGIEKNDVILKFGETKIEKKSDLGDALQEYNPGDRVKVTVKRKDKEVELEIELGWDPNIER